MGRVSIYPYTSNWGTDEVVTTTTTTEREYDAEGRLVKEVVSETKIVKKHNPNYGITYTTA